MATRGELQQLAATGLYHDPVAKTVTFADAAGQGAVGTVALYTVTGEVAVKLLAVCTTNLAGATATLAVGTAGTTAGLIAQSTATDIDAGEIWHDATPDAQIEASTVLAEKIIANGADIIATVGTAAITSGAIKFLLYWRPLSDGATVVAA